MRRGCIAKQPHILAGLENKIAFGSIAFQNANIPLRMQHQEPQVSVLMEVGKFYISNNADPYACRKGLVFSTGVTCHGFDAAIDYRIVAQSVGQEELKGIVLAFHGHAFSAVCFHHRRSNLHAFRFLDSAARMDDKGIIRFLYFGYPIIVQIFKFRFLRPGGDVAANGYVPGGRSKIHVVGCCKLAGCLHRFFGLQRNIVGCRNIAADSHSAVSRSGGYIIGCRKLTLCHYISLGLQRDIAFGICSISIRIKFRGDLDCASAFPVFYLNVSINNRKNGKFHIIRAIKYRNAALNGSIRDRALHCNSIEIVVHSPQIHTILTYDGNLFRLDSCRFFLSRLLGYSPVHRSQLYLFFPVICCKNPFQPLCQIFLCFQDNIAVTTDDTIIISQGAVF